MHRALTDIAVCIAVPALVACGGYVPPGPAAALPSGDPSVSPASLALRFEAASETACEQNTTLFILGTRAGGDGEPELRAQLPLQALPFTAQIDARSLLGAGSLRGQWTLEARLDFDGYDLARAGDLLGRAEVEIGADGGEATLVLSETISQDETLGDVPRFIGTIELSSEFAFLDGTRTLFISLKQNPTERGMPRAAVQIPRARFPVSFDIGPDDVPLDVENKADMLQGELWLVARLDTDGDGISRQAGDIETDPLAVRSGPEPVHIMLDTRRSR
jgi:hypothetical protein